MCCRISVSLLESLQQAIDALFELVNLELDPLQAFMLLDLPPCRRCAAGRSRCVRPGTSKEAALTDSDAGIAASDSYPASFLLPGVSGLVRCLLTGNELPVFRVTKNSLLGIPAHFVFLSF